MRDFKRAMGSRVFGCKTVHAKYGNENTFPISIFKPQELLNTSYFAMTVSRVSTTVFEAQ